MAMNKSPREDNSFFMDVRRRLGEGLFLDGFRIDRDLKGVDGLGTVSEVKGTHGLEIKGAIDDRADGLADQDGARLCGLLQAGRHVDRVAQRGKVPALA